MSAHQIVTVLPVRTIAQANELIQCIDQSPFNAQIGLIELRLDYLQQWDFEALKRLIKVIPKPAILTLRHKAQGGHFQGSENERLDKIRQLCALQSAYIDLEYDVPDEFLEQMSLQYPAIRWIRSYHDFDKTPESFISILKQMIHPNVYAYKFAVFAQNILDSLKLLRFIKEHASSHRIAGMCMGAAGECTRILAPVVGGIMTYAAWDAASATAPGQLSLDPLLSIYRIHHLNQHSSIYALLGDPVDASLGHIIHNQAMVYLEKNAVYVKLRVQPDELEAFMSLVSHLPFKGFSVTMPLKQKMMHYVTDVEQSAEAMQAINTLVVADKYKPDSHVLGINTDGQGALQAIASHLNIQGKTVILIGAGGAARGIASVLCQQGAHLVIMNRNESHANDIAKMVEGEVRPLTALSQLARIPHVLIINTLPNQVYSESALQNILQDATFVKGGYVMDIVYRPKHTTFIDAAINAGCIPIFGEEMFLHQALLQLKHWFAPTPEQLQAILRIWNKNIKAMT